MKKRFMYNLLVVAGVILLMGLIAGCGDSPEPQFRIIESKEYNNESLDSIRNALYEKHLSGKQALSNSQAIMDSYWDDVDPIIDAEMKSKMPTVGLVVVVKVDTYKALGRCYWAKGAWTYNYSMYNN